MRAGHSREGPAFLCVALRSSREGMPAGSPVQRSLVGAAAALPQPAALGQVKLRPPPKRAQAGPLLSLAPSTTEL